MSGGGVFVNDGDFTMSGTAKISGNEADSDGGGVYFVGAGDFTMSGTAKISGNAIGGYGGGVYFNSSTGTFTMSGGTIGGTADGEGNTTSSDGGGVCVDMGDFEIEGSAKIIGNEAMRGGGVYFYSSTGTDTFTMSGGTISGNTATTNGGGVYVAAGTFDLKGSAKISGNEASSGGGVFMNNGTFTMIGATDISGNSASSWGGGVYVNAGSFSKTGGIIRGKYVEGSTTDPETVAPNIANSNSTGHAAYVSSGSKKRNSTAGALVNLSSGDSSWE
jgi:hypothetical protein